MSTIRHRENGISMWLISFENIWDVRSAESPKEALVQDDSPLPVHLDNSRRDPQSRMLVGFHNLICGLLSHYFHCLISIEWWVICVVCWLRGLCPADTDSVKVQVFTDRLQFWASSPMRIPISSVYWSCSGTHVIHMGLKSKKMGCCCKEQPGLTHMVVRDLCARRCRNVFIMLGF